MFFFFLITQVLFECFFLILIGFFSIQIGALNQLTKPDSFRQNEPQSEKHRIPTKSGEQQILLQQKNRTSCDL